MKRGPVKSTDPVKARVVAEMKRIFGGSKVTSVRHLGDGIFTGRCFSRLDKNGKPVPFWYEIGTCTVVMDLETGTFQGPANRDES